MDYEQLQVPEEIRNQIIDILADRFGKQFISASFANIEEDGDQLILVMEVKVSKGALDGQRSIPSFFGLTRVVQRALGSDVFPVFKPVAVTAA